MKSRDVVKMCAVSLALAMPTPGVAAQQAAPGQDAPAAAPQQNASAAIGECAQAQPRVAQTIDAANMRIEGARQSNSPAAMRAAMDDLQGALGSLRAQLAACTNLQATAPADGHGGHAMPGTPNVQQSPAAQPGTPVMQPGTTRPAPGAINQSAPAPAASAPVDPHAGHVMPGAVSPSPAPPAGQATPRQPGAPGAQPQGAAPAPSAPAAPVAAGGHAGHAMPAAGAMNLVRDPRCTASVNPETAPRAEHAGQSYYFCTERDRQLFVADPVKYLQGASAAQPASAGRATTRPSAGARPAAPAAADPHAGHVMPGVPQPAPARGSSAQPPASPARPAPDQHAGHATPQSGSSPARGGAPAAAQPGGRPQAVAPATGEHGGHVMSPTPQAAATSRREPTAGSGATTATLAALSSGRRPATAFSELKCDGRVNQRTAPRMLHQGRMYYFCSVEERTEFANDPGKYVGNAPASVGAPAHGH